MSRVLVIGGSGFVGRHVCEKLVAAGHRVTVPTRRAANAQRVQCLPLVTVLEANVHDTATLARIVKGHDVVVNLVAILHGSGAEFTRTHVQLPIAIAQACLAARVPRLVHVSAIGADVAGPSMYLRSKGEGEATLQSAAQSGDLQVVLLRPSVIFGEGDALLNLFAKLQTIFPVVPLAGAGALFQPVWVEDVAQLLVKMAICPTSTAFFSYEKNSNQQMLHWQMTVALLAQAAGPKVMTLRQLVQCAGVASGHPRPVFGLPHSLARLQALAMEWAPGPTLMSRDNLASMSVPNVAEPGIAGLRDWGIEPSSIDAIAPTYLSGQGPRKALDGLRRNFRR